MNTQENNKLIAEFMGCTHPFNEIHDATLYKIEQGTFELDELQYHKSWDWLMLVVNKIEDMGCEVVMTNAECTISGANDYYVKSIGKSRIGATYLAVVEFINEYNKNK